MKKNNILLAIFLGWVEQTDPTERWFGGFRDLNGTVHRNTDKEPLLFHSDWNWLMQVVEKIFSLDIYYDKYIEHNSSMFSDGKIQLTTNINSVFEQCIEFVKWYNQQK